MGLYESDDCDVMGVGDAEDPDIPDPAKHPAELAAAAAASDDPGNNPAWSEIPPPIPPPPGEGGRSNGESRDGVDWGETLRHNGFVFLDTSYFSVSNICPKVDVSLNDKTPYDFSGGLLEMSK